MNRKILVTTSMAACIGILIAITVKHTPPENLGTTSSDRAVDLQGPSSRAGDDRRSTVRLTEVHNRPLSGIASFGELVVSLNGSDISPAQKAQYLITASQVCDGLRGTAPPSVQSSSTDIYFDFVEAFCIDRHGDTQDYVNQAAMHPESDVAISKEMAASAPLSRDLAIEAQEIVLMSMDPDAIRNAAEALISSKWAFSVDSTDESSSLAMLPQAQAIASQRVACDISGGCGPGEISSMIECSGGGVCRKNISFNEALEASFSAEQLDLADKVYLELLNARSIEASKSLR